MDEIKEAITLAMQEFRKKYGEDARLEEGEEFVAIFNNCVLVISFEDREAGFHFIGGEPLRVDMSLSAYKDTE